MVIPKANVKLDSLINDFRLFEENVFISRVSDIALEDKDLVISKVLSVLDNPAISIHLRYLLIKVVGVLKFQKFLPILTKLLNSEDKVRIIYEILNSLTNIISIESYKVVVSFFSDKKNTNYLPRFNTYLKRFFGKSPLIYHFDVFYRDRGEVKNIELSSAFLIKSLNETYIKDLMPAIFSKYEPISFEMLNILKSRPGPLFYGNIYDLFQKKYLDKNGLFFEQLTQALIINASKSPHKKKIYIKIKPYINQLPKRRKNYFIVFLLLLNSKDILDDAIHIYGELKPEERIIFLNNLDPDIYIDYQDFISKQVFEETNNKVLLKIIFILLKHKKYNTIFNTVSKLKGSRRETLINLIIETGQKGLSPYFSKFISLLEQDSVLLSLLDYIINDSPDDYYEQILKILFSGVHIKIKQKIVRNIKNFKKSNIVKILKHIFNNTSVINGIEKDFLLLVISLQNKDIFNDILLDQLLNKVLLIMEEADPSNLVNFIYFFDSFDIQKDKHKALIIDELKMIQGTLLKKAENDNLVNMIYILIKKIEN